MNIRELFDLMANDLGFFIPQCEPLPSIKELEDCEKGKHQMRPVKIIGRKFKNKYGVELRAIPISLSQCAICGKQESFQVLD